MFHLPSSSALVKQWLETFPDKITHETPNALLVGVQSSGSALAKMILAGEVDPAQVLKMAHSARRCGDI
jgi:hypothetical protein